MSFDFVWLFLDEWFRNVRTLVRANSIKHSVALSETLGACTLDSNADSLALDVWDSQVRGL